MDGLAIKEAFDAILYKGCLFSLAGLSVLYLLAKCGFRKEIEDFIKKAGPFFVIFFFTWAAWAFISSSPTQEEKEEILKAQRRQEEIKKAWGEVFAGGMVDAFNRVEQVERVEGGVVGDSCSGRKEGETTTTLTANDFERGFVLTHIGTNEVFDFSAPTNAVMCDDWLQFGAAEDWVYLESGEHLRVHSDGWLTALAPTSAVFSAKEFYPFKTTLGIAPLSSNSYLLTPISCFWHEYSPSNTLVMTWQNALFNRLTDAPISFQIECFNNGNFVYRYDLASIRAKLASGEYSENWTSNILIGAKSQNASASLLLCGSALKNITLSSLIFSRLDPTDSPGSDRDGDGLTIEDELFIHRTDPYNADSDYDGLSDYDEIFIHSSDPNNPSSIRANYPDGIAAVLGSLDPFSCPAGSTNTVYEHIFYTGTTNTPFAYPQPTEQTAVLKISVSGSGSGRLVVGDKVVPIIARGNMVRRDRSDVTLSLSLAKDILHKIFYLGDDTVFFELDSDEFAFGSLSKNIRNSDYIFFPRISTSSICIHDFNARKQRVAFPVAEGAQLMSCEWKGSDEIKVENFSPRSAEITGYFSAKEQRTVTYTLSHPQYLFGKKEYTQQVAFCPRPKEGDDAWVYHGEGNSSLENNLHNECWCCYWGVCHEAIGCTCGCIDLAIDTELPWDFYDVCPEHEISYSECAPIHANAYTNALTTVSPLQDVLYIRDPLAYEEIYVEPPTGHIYCCSCPEHNTNYVMVAYKSYRLHLIDEEGKAFSRSTKPETLRLAGVYPSSEVGDATLAFCRNGEIYEKFAKTVLGVGIKGSGFDLYRYRRLNSKFGYPITVCTDVSKAAQLELVTNVKLDAGNYSLELADVKGQFAVWYYDDAANEYRKLLDSDGRAIKNFSNENWKKIMRRAGTSANNSSLPIRITSSRSGTVRLCFKYWAVVNGKFVQDQAECVITSLVPPAKLDMNHNGRLDENDIAFYLDGRVFRFWTNEETIKGDLAGAVDDVSPNVQDQFVNGRYDLLNFFPMMLDLSSFVEAWGERVTYRIKPSGGSEGAFNFCFAEIPHMDLRQMQIGNVLSSDGTPLSAARLHKLDKDGYVLSGEEVEALSNASVLLAIEACKYGETLTLAIENDEGVLYSYEIPLSITPLKYMYRWMNLRPVVGDASGEYSMLGSPYNYPDEECDGRHFVFVHGYNVNAGSARVWADQMFKRLWWAGSKAMFTAVDWRGDESQIYMPVLGDTSPNYYINVRHAFMTAEAASQQINALPGRKIVLAHSLGNMLASSAIKDLSLSYSKYYMLNAAVPMEAYDENAYNSMMVDGAWSDIPESMRASRFADLFTQTADDFRLGLSWKGRFAGIVNTVNCYSPTEDVLSNPTEIKIFGKAIGENFGGAWSKQELFKGCSLWAGVNTFTFAGAEIEGGWGINAHYMLNPLAYVPLVGFNASYFENYNREDLITKPLFSSMNDSRMHSTNALNFVDSELRAKMLGDAIPAESFAAGANEISGFVNYNMQTETPNGWPRVDSDDNAIWQHSDIKNVAFYFTFELFKKINEGK